MKDMYAASIVVFLFAIFMIGFYWSDIQAGNIGSQFFYAFSIISVLIIGILMANKGIQSAKKKTDKIMGYGPYVNYFRTIGPGPFSHIFGRHWYSWPANYYHRNKDSTVNYLSIKDEFKPKVSAWQEEYKKSKRFSALFIIGLLLIALSVILLAASLYMDFLISMELAKSYAAGGSG